MPRKRTKAWFLEQVAAIADDDEHRQRCLRTLLSTRPDSDTYNALLLSVMFKSKEDVETIAWSFAGTATFDTVLAFIINVSPHSKILFCAERGRALCVPTLLHRSICSARTGDDSQMRMMLDHLTIVDVTMMCMSVIGTRSPTRSTITELCRAYSGMSKAGWEWKHPLSLWDRVDKISTYLVECGVCAGDLNMSGLTFSENAHAGHAMIFLAQNGTKTARFMRWVDHGSLMFLLDRTYGPDDASGTRHKFRIEGYVYFNDVVGLRAHLQRHELRASDTRICLIRDVDDNSILGSRVQSPEISRVISILPQPWMETTHHLYPRRHRTLFFVLCLLQRNLRKTNLPPLPTEIILMILRCSGYRATLELKE
jgi:hypothetical protein